MTRYEYFEKWMTHEEWETWKRLSPSRFKSVHELPNLREARLRRKSYLNKQVEYVCIGDAIDDFQTMVNMYLHWSETPQGHSHWYVIHNERTNPIR